MAKSEEVAEKVKPKPKYKVPRAVGAAIDLLDKVRDARKAMQAKADAERAQEALIETQIFELFGKGDLEGARGRRAQASIKRSDVPTIEDFDKVWAYAKKNDAGDLFRRQLVVEAVRERWAAGKVVPGVGTFTKISLHLTKTKR